MLVTCPEDSIENTGDDEATTPLEPMPDEDDAYKVNEHVLITQGSTELPALIVSCNPDGYTVKYYEKARRRADFAYQAQSSTYDVEKGSIIKGLAEPDCEVVDIWKKNIKTETNHQRLMVIYLICHITLRGNQPLNYHLLPILNYSIHHVR